jgi:general secretion pathway protein C
MLAAWSHSLQRTSLAIIPFGLGIIAILLQASAITQLLDAAFCAPRPFMPPSTPVKTPSTSALVTKSARSILARNVFDSKTGPMVEQSAPQPKATAPTDPLVAAPCDDTKALIVTESTDPAWSVATLLSPGERLPRVRRIGDPVGSKQVAFIGYNPRYRQPAVWLAAGAEICQALLFAPVLANSASTTPTNARPTPEGLAVERANVERALSEREKVLRFVRAVPVLRDGEVIGLRLSGIRPDSLLGLLGLRNADMLESINGFNVGNLERALEAYLRLRTAERLKLRLVRDGHPVTIDYEIR